jgi:hypothetical protein
MIAFLLNNNQYVVLEIVRAITARTVFLCSDTCQNTDQPYFDPNLVLNPAKVVEFNEA